MHSLIRSSSQIRQRYSDKNKLQAEQISPRPCSKHPRLAGAKSACLGCKQERTALHDARVPRSASFCRAYPVNRSIASGTLVFSAAHPVHPGAQAAVRARFFLRRHPAFLLHKNLHTYTRAARLLRIFEKKLPSVLLSHELYHIKADAEMPVPSAAFVPGKKLLRGVL